MTPSVTAPVVTNLSDATAMSYVDDDGIPLKSCRNVEDFDKIF